MEGVTAAAIGTSKKTPQVQSGNAVVGTVHHQTTPGHQLAWQLLRLKRGRLSVSCFGWGSKNYTYRQQVSGLLEERGSCLTRRQGQSRSMPRAECPVISGLHLMDKGT